VLPPVQNGLGFALYFRFQKRSTDKKVPCCERYEIRWILGHRRFDSILARRVDSSSKVYFGVADS